MDRSNIGQRPRAANDHKALNQGSTISNYRNAKPTEKMNNNRNQEVCNSLLNSKTYQEYASAFTEATGMPVVLRAAESWQLPLRGTRYESPFCAMMARASHTCSLCMQVQEELMESARDESCTVNCPAGLSDTAVPVRVGDQLIGFLQTGQVFRNRPSERQFKVAAGMATKSEQAGDIEELKVAYFKTRRLTPVQHDAAVRLLSIFAQHLAIISNRIMVQQKNAEPPMITKAKNFIIEHQGEPLSLARVAKAVNTSTYYFCKIFKKFTGLNFVEFLSRVRIERARELLMNPNLRISEIAFEVGFQSLTHFNRVFKKIGGESPSEFRARMAVA